MKQLTKHLQILILGLIILVLPCLALANNQISVSVKNSAQTDNSNNNRFEFEEPAGGSATGTLILRNTGAEAETVKLYPADAVNNEAGSFILKQLSETQKGLGLWTKMELTEVTLQPEETKEVDFIIHVPKDTTPGQYFGGIIKEDIVSDCPNGKATTGMETTNNSDTNNGNNKNCADGNIQIKTRIGTRIYFTVPGEIREDIKLIGSSYQPGLNNNINFKFKIQNQGNIGYEPKAIIDIYDIFGQKIDTLEEPLGKSLPDSIIEPQVTWQSKAFFGKFTAKAQILFLEIDYGNQNQLHKVANRTTAEIQFFLVPWSILCILIMLAFGTTGFVFYRKYTFQKLICNASEYTVKENETIEDLAARQKISWRAIARINHLSAPYVIKASQKIKLPSKHKHE
jgi:hypothetical protein